MPLFQSTITLLVEADDADQARGIADGAAQHLFETFNDDNSLIQTVGVEAEPYLTDAQRLQAAGVWFSPVGPGVYAFDRGGHCLAHGDTQTLAARAAAAVLRAR